MWQSSAIYKLLIQDRPWEGLFITCVAAGVVELKEEAKKEAGRYRDHSWDCDMHLGCTWEGAPITTFSFNNKNCHSVTYAPFVRIRTGIV